MECQAGITEAKGSLRSRVLGREGTQGGGKKSQSHRLVQQVLVF